MIAFKDLGRIRVRFSMSCAEAAVKEGIIMDSNDERKFLHDLSNPVPIGYGNLRIIVSKLQKTPDALSTEQLLERLSIAVDAFERVNDLLADRRKYLKSVNT